MNHYKQYKTLHCTQIIESHHNMVECSSTNVDSGANNFFSFSSNECNDPIQDLK